MRPGDKFIADIYFKVAHSEMDFRAFCLRQHFSVAQKEKFLSIQAPHYPKSAIIWRIDIRTIGPTNSLTIPLSLTTISEEYLPTGFAKEYEDYSVPLYRMLCLKESPEDKYPKPIHHSFSRKLRLNINTNQGSFRLSPSEKAALVSTVLDAASLWTRACVACQPQQLVAVEVDDVLYVTKRVNGWLKELQALKIETKALPVSSKDEDDLLSALQPVYLLNYAPQRVGPAKGQGFFDWLDSPPKIIKNPQQRLYRHKELAPYMEAETSLIQFFCQLKIDAKKTPIAESVHRAICNESIAPNEIAKIRIRFRDGAMFCGDNQNIIACWADRELTEYNARDFRFVTHGKNPVAIGNGKIRVDFEHVIVHEVGHWLGLNHIDEGDSIMASSMENSRCIDSTTIDRLASQGKQQIHSKKYQAFLLKNLTKSPRPKK